MKAALLILLLAFATAAPAQQNRSAELDRAVDEARAASLALQQAQARRDQGIESLAGERTGSAAGGSRPNENYYARQAILEHELMFAQRRYDAAMKRWNDLK